MKNQLAITTFVAISMLFVFESARGERAIVDTCSEIQKKAQQGPLTDEEKRTLRNCVLNGSATGPNNEVVKDISNAHKAIMNGPGPNNDLVGKEGWIRKSLGF